MMRKYNHLVSATQRPDANSLSGQIRNNIDCRVCGRADNVRSQIILDSTDAAELIPKDALGLMMVRYSKAICLTRTSCNRGVPRKKPNDHGTGIPLHEIEALARILLPQIQAFFESEEGQREYAEWKAQQEVPKE